MESTVILASSSQARARLLAAAGVEFELYPARVDEAAVRKGLLNEGASPRDVADTLASFKAARISSRHPGRLVLGADQVLVVGDQLLEKAGDLAMASKHLKLLRGKHHELFSAAVIYEDSCPVWRYVGTARLTMRAFSDAFLEGYLTRHGDELLNSVGAYKVEQGGAVLFERIEGDYFSVLGLPLLEVLAYLRVRGVIPE